MPGKKREIGRLDLDTDEVLEGVSVLYHKKRNPYPESQLSQAPWTIRGNIP